MKLDGPISEVGDGFRGSVHKRRVRCIEELVSSSDFGLIDRVVLGAAHIRVGKCLRERMFVRFYVVLHHVIWGPEFT